MRIISKSRQHFHGTHKGYVIEIERERPPVESFGDRHFYIRVFNEYGHAYDGYSPAGVTTFAEAKREALYGACLAKRPDVGSTPEAEGCAMCEGSGQIPHPDDPVSYDCDQCGGTGEI